MKKEEKKNEKGENRKVKMNSVKNRWKLMELGKNNRKKHKKRKRKEKRIKEQKKWKTRRKNSKN